MKTFLKRPTWKGIVGLVSALSVLVVFGLTWCMGVSNHITHLSDLMSNRIINRTAMDSLILQRQDVILHEILVSRQANTMDPAYGPKEPEYQR